jgi:hypothetical protein
VPEQNADLISAGVLINNINTFGLHLPLNIGNPPRPDQGFLSRGRASFSSPVPFKTGTTFFFQDVDNGEAADYRFYDCAGSQVDAGDFDFLKISTINTPNYALQGTAPTQYWHVSAPVAQDPNTVNGIVINASNVCRIDIQGTRPQANGSINYFLGTPPNVVPTAVPTISGPPVAGSPVTGSYVYADADNNAEDTTDTGTTYTFVTSPTSTLTNSGDGTVVAGGPTNGTSPAYTPTAGDVNQYLFFCVTPIAATGANPGLEVCTPAGQVSSNAPVPSGIKPVPSLSTLPLMGLAGMLGLLGFWRRRRG